MSMRIEVIMVRVLKVMGLILNLTETVKVVSGAGVDVLVRWFT